MIVIHSLAQFFKLLICARNFLDHLIKVLEEKYEIVACLNTFKAYFHPLFFINLSRFFELFVLKVKFRNLL